MQAMSELLGNRQAELSKSLSERLDGMTHRLNQSMGEATKSTHENLKNLHERLAVLNSAQANISDLAGQVTTLSNILANKQTRGAFGQGRMEAIVADNLPAGSYAFQYTLKSGGRPDCVIYLPNDAPPLVVDAKFPLEAYNALNAAASPEALKAAQTQFRNDVAKHIRDISEKYLVPGETHDTAFMFVPSESVFARDSRELRRSDPARLPLARRHRLALAPSALDSGDPAGAPRSSPARAGARHPGRGADDDARRGAVRRSGAKARQPLRHGGEGHRADSDFDARR